ncbi:hypothetical protein BpHYR1_015992 [Brachionus plicatilis]|uniref:Uncharacterized protein n=1 Tax=Brachionus plicatilis TaxID=10195 RepID=A0A3M7PAU7_BRAPC|nr:hypothetical protein BpHYR1_015992 [Brachionus plicatilis]
MANNLLCKTIIRQKCSHNKCRFFKKLNVDVEHLIQVKYTLFKKKNLYLILCLFKFNKFMDFVLNYLIALKHISWFKNFKAKNRLIKT